MAHSKVSPWGTETFQAASALTGLGEFFFAKLTTDGKIDVPSDGDLCVVLWDAPALNAAYVEGNSYTCVYADVAKVVAGESLNAAVAVTSDGSGKAVAAESGDHINGVTLAPAASGDIVAIRMPFSGATHA